MMSMLRMEPHRDVCWATQRFTNWDQRKKQEAIVEVNTQLYNVFSYT